jgi:uncharacterized membrane protein YbhN (UPF0104 family)
MVMAENVTSSTWGAGYGRGLALRFSVSLATSAFFLGALFAGASLGRILEALARLRPEWLILALAGIVLILASRAQRWAVMLRCSGAPIRFRDAAVPLVGAAALNNLLPFDVGGAVRMIALRSFTTRITQGHIATLVLERLFDGCALVALGLTTLALAVVDHLGRELAFPVGLLALALSATGLLQLSLRAGQARQAIALVRSLATPRRSGLLQPAVLTHLTGLTVAAWLAEGLTAFAAAKALGLADGLRTALFTLTFGGLSKALPTLPAHLGAFDYFAASAAKAAGAPAAAAVAYALLLHALLWMVTTVVGWLLLVGSGRIGVLRGSAPHPAELETFR